MFNKMHQQKGGNRRIFLLNYLSRLRNFYTREINVDWSMLINSSDANDAVDDCVDAIVIIPYIGSIPAEYGLLSLTWLGHDYKKLDSVLTGGKRQRKDVDRFREGYG